MSDQTLKIPLVWSPTSSLHCQVPVQFSLSVFVFPHGNVGSVWPGSRSEVLPPSLSLPPLVFKVGSYGGKLKYTISYVAGSRGTLLEDADIQIIVSTLSLIDVCLSWWPVFFLTTAVDPFRETTSLWSIVSRGKGGIRAAERLRSLRLFSERWDALDNWARTSLKQGNRITLKKKSDIVV